MTMNEYLSSQREPGEMPRIFFQPIRAMTSASLSLIAGIIGKHKVPARHGGYLKIDGVYKGKPYE